jgi:hypothetical protein
MTDTGTEMVVVPHTGELVNLNDPTECAVALDELRTLETKIKDIKSVLVDAITQYAEQAGAGKTLNLPGGVRAVLKNDKQVLWDAQQLEEDLRAAGMSEERIREIVVEEVSYKVVANEAKKAASVNSEYAKAVDDARHEIPQRASITVQRAT